MYENKEFRISFCKYSLYCTYEILSDMEKSVDEWCDKGAIFAQLGKHLDAIECFNEALKINPNHEKTLYNKGYSFFQLGKGKEAYECFDKVKEIELKDKI